MFPPGTHTTDLGNGVWKAEVFCTHKDCKEGFEAIKKGQIQAVNAARDKRAEHLRKDHPKE